METVQVVKDQELYDMINALQMLSTFSVGEVARMFKGHFYTIDQFLKGINVVNDLKATTTYSNELHEYVFTFERAD